MNSEALGKFRLGVSLGNRIRETANDERLRPNTHEQIHSFLHAALASYVASWDSYLNNVVREFATKISKPLDSEFSKIHGLHGVFVERSLKKFNTPNSNNARTLLIDSTGYDPINDWKWPRGKMNATETRDLLDQILKVRHSFAHGFEMPIYEWTTSPTGKRRLTRRSLVRVEAFLLHLANTTDAGLAAHAKISFPSANIWR